MLPLLLSLRKFQDFGDLWARNHGEDQKDIRNTLWSFEWPNVYFLYIMISHIQICTSGSALGEVQSRIAVFQHLAGAPMPLVLSASPHSPHLQPQFQPHNLRALFLLFNSLILAVLGLRCCLWAFSSCREWGLLSGCGAAPSHYGILLQSTGSRVPQLQQLWHRGLVALQHVGS